MKLGVGARLRRNVEPSPTKAESSQTGGWRESGNGTGTGSVDITRNPGGERDASNSQLPVKWRNRTSSCFSNPPRAHWSWTCDLLLRLRVGKMDQSTLTALADCIFEPVSNLRYSCFNCHFLSGGRLYHKIPAKSRTLAIRRSGRPGATTCCSSFLQILATTLLVQSGCRGPHSAT